MPVNDGGRRRWCRLIPESLEAHMTIRTEFPFAVMEEPDLAIVMSDGCRLSARIWRPVEAGPAVLEYIPCRATR